MRASVVGAKEIGGGKGGGLGERKRDPPSPPSPFSFCVFSRPSPPCGRLFEPCLQALQTKIVSLSLKVNDTKTVKTERGINHGFLGIMGSK